MYSIHFCVINMKYPPGAQYNWLTSQVIPTGPRSIIIWYNEDITSGDTANFHIVACSFSIFSSIAFVVHFSLPESIFLNKIPSFHRSNLTNKWMTIFDTFVQDWHRNNSRLTYIYINVLFPSVINTWYLIYVSDHLRVTLMVCFAM